MSGTPGETVRGLIRAADKAVLSTHLAETGEPYGSLVLAACDHVARPLLLLSDLAVHTANLKADARASLLVDGTAGRRDPLTGARASLQGTVEAVPEAETEPLTARFVRRHPSAEIYAGFGDFALYRMIPERAHLVAGFGRIDWVAADAFLIDMGDAEALAGAEAGIVDHMNADHSDAVGLYANVLLGRAGAGWRMTGVDPEGADLRRGVESARLPFDRRVTDAETARAELVRLVKRARG